MENNLVIRTSEFTTTIGNNNPYLLIVLPEKREQVLGEIVENLHQEYGESVQIFLTENVQIKKELERDWLSIDLEENQLAKLEDICKSRFKMFHTAGAKCHDEYYKKVGEKLTRVILCVNKISLLEVDPLVPLIKLGRAAGIHIIATTTQTYKDMDMYFSVKEL